ncbi:n19m, NADH-ubiquinone oxidoreductase 9.5 kDa subunit [Knufia obscura]|uniref:N19m, NADH-ubiquinone oxidoreductase 9.5 kDa subunit n=2 Tax=Knufia TaxID=430999 RepID=A0AAN8IN11_9EURO|nr:n19m, NADH-ubiquinone oxidoreductase 9.5 kDa subunit [Knufia obscura]KAK5953752.1 n19m, NADH-ubiquinone oxidoreductase 9.5 kDa subunit [Knufia fluminis]
MSTVPKNFISSPLRYLKWASYEKPAIFYSVILGCMGPVSLLTVPTMRRWAGDETPKRIPLTYPVPEGPRQIPSGYDD